VKVLLSAYACEPGKGSEPGVGWNVALEMARRHDVWLLTRANNRDAIEAALERQPVPRLHVAYLDLPRSLSWWKRGSRGVNLYYYAWQLALLATARRLHRGVGFDLAHHITFGRYWSPSFISSLPVPFVWGPVGGGESAPRSFYEQLEPSDARAERRRDFARGLGERDPFVRRTARRSAVALATTGETAERLRALGAAEVKVLARMAYTRAPGSEATPSRSDELGPRTGPFRLISAGRLLYWKGFHLGLRAFAEARLGDAEYWIVGDGPDHARLEALARGLGIEDRVRFVGRVPRQRALALLGEADVLVHPSFHDSGGFVCIEALAAGTPVVCLALGGPAVHVTDDTGIRVPAHEPHQVQRDLASAIVRLRDDPSLRSSMAAAGRRRIVDEYSWAAKGLALCAVYEEAVRGPSRPGRAAEGAPGARASRAD
jgi:glycosyltransferase involved in cell wall biosynthesis